MSRVVVVITYTAIGGHDKAPQLRAKWMRGSHVSWSERRGSSFANGGLLKGAAEALFPLNRPFSISFSE